MKSLLYSGTILYVPAPVYHSLSEFFINACSVLDSVLRERSVKENGRTGGESKRELRKGSALQEERERANISQKG